MFLTALKIKIEKNKYLQEVDIYCLKRQINRVKARK